MWLQLTTVLYVFIAVAMIGHFMFGEALGAQKMAAIGLICGGVVLLASAQG